MRIGVFGGSFDPVHLGHLIVAESCREQARLDRVLFVPAATQPHKQDRRLAAPHHRVEMLRLAACGHEAFDVSTAEIDRGGVSYTVDTLAALAATHPNDALCLILGPDALADLPTWREPERIVAAAEIIAVERDSIDDIAALVTEPRLAALLGPAHAARIAATRVRVPAIGIRSSDLRAAIAAGHSIRYRTPRAVERSIASHGLYAL
ncbi:MAG: nicotinate-nucleotide adenylyltransferase [Planctomycetaceae bacterium]